MNSETEAYFDWLKGPGGGNCVMVKDLGHGVYGAVKPLMYHYTLMIGMIGDKCSWFDNYCYQTRNGAEKALTDWDGTGDPGGWHRNPKTGRRRTDGDKAKEYIAW